MKILKWVRVAVCNIVTNMSFFKQMVFGISLVTTILIIITLLKIGVANAYGGIVYGKSCANSINLSSDLDEFGNFTSDASSILQELKNTGHVPEVSIYASVDMGSAIRNSENLTTPSSNLSLSVNNEEDGENFVLSNRFSDAFLANFFFDSGCVFANSDYESFNYYYPKEQLITKGKEAKHAGEIMLSEELLSSSGIDNYDKILGKKVVISIGKYIFADGAIVTGIINSKYYLTPAYRIFAKFIIVGSKNDFSRYQIKRLNMFAPIDSPENGREVFTHIKSIGYEDLVEYDSGAATEYYYIVRIKSVVEYIFYFAITFIAAAMTLSVYSVLSNYLSKKLHYFGMMMAMGIKRAEILIIFATELFLINVAATLSSAAASGLLIRIINYLAGKSVGADVKIKLSQYLFVSTTTSLTIGIFVILVGGIMVGIAIRNEISCLLRQGR